MENDDVIAVHLHCHTNDKEKAARAIDSLARMMLGLTLDGLSVSLSSMILDEYEELEEYEEVDGEEESGA